jgi:hypothetical protein
MLSRKSGQIAVIGRRGPGRRTDRSALRRAASIVRGNRVAGVETIAGTWLCAFVIDATGRQRWLARAFNLLTERHGPPQVAWFGYAEGHRPALDPNLRHRMDMDGAHTPKSLPMGSPAAARSAAPYRLAAGRIRRSAADAPATRHRRQLDYCKSYSRAGIFSYRRCGVDRRPVVVTWHLEGCHVGHEGGASFGGCLAVCRQPGRGRECLPRLARTVVLSGPLSPRRTLSRYWPVAWVMIGNGEHFGVKSRPNGRRGYLISKPNYSSSPAAGTTTNATRSAKRSSTKTTRS